MSNTHKIRLTLGHKIKRARQLAGYNQRQLADILQISDKSISAYEVNRAEPSLRVLDKMSQALNQPLSYFVNDKQAIENQDVYRDITDLKRELSQIKTLLYEVLDKVQ